MSDSTKPPVPLALILSGQPSKKRRVVRSIRQGGKVLIVPCPDGSVKLVGVTAAGGWVGEWHCLAVDFRETMIDRMVRHVRSSKAVGLPRIHIV